MTQIIHSLWKNVFSSKRFWGLFLIGVMIILILIPQVSAGLFEFDNIKTFDSKVNDYGIVEIRNSILGINWLQLDKVATLELKTNTEICNGNDCEAVKEIVMYEDGKLIDEIRFMNEEKTRKEYIKNYKIQYKVNDKWIDYNYEKVKGDSYGIVYEVKLEGELFGFQKVDWQIKSQGIWIEEWAVWTSGLNVGLVSYYNFDETSGTNAEDSRYGTNNGTLQGMTDSNWKTGGDCKLGGCLKIDGGNSELVNISDDDSLDLDEGTFNFWISKVSSDIHE